MDRNQRWHRRKIHGDAPRDGPRTPITPAFGTITKIGLLGFFLIFANLSAILVNLIGSVVYALLIPYVAIGRTLLYFDLGAREAAGMPKRRGLRLRPRPATGTS